MFAAATDEGVVATVVVVTYAGVRWLDRCLDAVAAQDLATQGRVACWVVDNASTDGSAQVLARRTDGVRVLRSPANLGFAGGNNVALRELTTPYAVLVNDDAVPQPGWLDGLLAPFADDRVGAVTGKLLLLPRAVAVPVRAESGRRLGVAAVRRDGDDITGALVWDPLLSGAQDDAVLWCVPDPVLLVPVPDAGDVLDRPVRVEVDVVTGSPGVVPAAGRAQQVLQPGRLVVQLEAGTATTDVVNSAGTVLLDGAYAADRGFGQADDGRYDDPAEVFGGCGASLALRTSALRDVGLFDDDWFLYYEDVDLCWRLRRRGWQVRYAPAAVARHEHSGSVGTRSDLHVFHDARNRLLTLAKNASLPLLVRTVGRYPLTTAAGALRAARPGGPSLGPTRMRLRVLVSFLRLLPGVLVRRRTVQRSATVPRRAVEAWTGLESGPAG